MALDRASHLWHIFTALRVKGLDLGHGFISWTYICDVWVKLSLQINKEQTSRLPVLCCQVCGYEACTCLVTRSDVSQKYTTAGKSLQGWLHIQVHLGMLCILLNHIPCHIYKHIILPWDPVTPDRSHMSWAWWTSYIECCSVPLLLCSGYP